MPPFGLYQVPRYHLNGGAPSVARPSFNSMDFQDDTPKPVENESLLIEKKYKKRKKKKRSLSVLSQVKEEQIKKPPQTPADATPAAASSKEKKSKEKNERRGLISKSESATKRKRYSAGHEGTPTVLRNGSSNNTSLLSGEFLQDLKTTMGDLSATFNDLACASQVFETAPPKKKKKSNTKNELELSKCEVTGHTVNALVDDVSSGENKIKKKRGRPSTQGRMSNQISLNKTAVAPAVASLPKQTPVPLPETSPLRRITTVNDSQQKQAKTSRKEVQVLVSETPPSQMFRLSTSIVTKPIPFNILPISAKPTKAPQKSRKGPTVALSPKISEGDEVLVSEAPKVLRAPIAISGIQTSLTSSNLLRYTQPLNDQPKPRPRGRAESIATSVAASTGSSASSMSIKEAFARVAKPYSRSDAEIDPFIVPEAKKRKYRETHEEGDIQTFVEVFKASQKTVNFTDEREYLDQYLKWRVGNDAAGPLPCLNKATGCNAKREQMLRLSKEDPSSLLKVLVTNEGDASALEDAKQRCAEAEGFLTLAVAARVPVPLGRLEGTWNLYCPKYSDTHVDKYGFGQRTLSISSIAGFKSNSTYMARLSIPPRSMAYTLLSFNAPPHASFRTTMLKTSVEAYKMEVVFLGNGYLHLRVDLSLLLTGKPMEKTSDGQPMVMEFIGVHEAAIQWTEKKDELEETGKRLFANHDGGAIED